MSVGPAPIVLACYCPILLGCLICIYHLWPDASYRSYRGFEQSRRRRPALAIAAAATITDLLSEEKAVGDGNDEEGRRFLLAAANGVDDSNPPSPAAGAILSSNAAATNPPAAATTTAPGALAVNNNLTAGGANRSDTNHGSKRSLEWSLLGQQLTTKTFWKLTIFFTLVTFWTSFYMSTIDVRLGASQSVHLADDLRTNEILILSLTVGAMVEIILLGHTFDSLTGTAASVLFLGASTMMIAAGEWWLGTGEELLMMALVLTILFKTFAFTYYFIAIHAALGPTFLPILSGASFSLAGAINLLQKPLLKVIDLDTNNPAGRWEKWCLLCSMVLLLGWLLRDFIVKYRDRRRRGGGGSFFSISSFSFSHRLSDHEGALGGGGRMVSNCGIYDDEAEAAAAASMRASLLLEAEHSKGVEEGSPAASCSSIFDNENASTTAAAAVGRAQL